MDNASRTHRLKTHPAPFSAILDGSKRFEVRHDDRGFRTGDSLQLEEWEPIAGRYTDRSCRALVTYLLRGGDFGLPEGLVVMSLSDVRET